MRHRLDLLLASILLATALLIGIGSPAFAEPEPELAPEAVAVADVTEDEQLDTAAEPIEGEATEVPKISTHHY